MSKQARQFFLVFARCFMETGFDSRWEIGEVLIMMRVQTLRLDKFPEPFDEIEMGGIGGQKIVRWYGAVRLRPSPIDYVDIEHYPEGW